MKIDVETERIQRERQEFEELARQAEIARAADKLRRAIEENPETSLGMVFDETIFAV